MPIFLSQSRSEILKPLQSLQQNELRGHWLGQVIRLSGCHITKKPLLRTQKRLR